MEVVAYFLITYTEIYVSSIIASLCTSPRQPRKGLDEAVAIITHSCALRRNHSNQTLLIKEVILNMCIIEKIR